MAHYQTQKTKSPATMPPDQALLWDALGERLRDIRREKQLSQETLAEWAGISPTMLGCIERGKKRTSLDHIYACCVGLGITLDDLLVDSFRRVPGYVTDRGITVGFVENSQEQVRDIMDQLRRVYRSCHALLIMNSQAKTRDRQNDR